MTILIFVALFIAYAGLGVVAYLSSERANNASRRADLASAELRRVTALLLAEVDAAKRRSHARVIGEVPPFRERERDMPPLPPLAGVSLKKMALNDPFNVITSEAPIIGYGEVVEMVRKRYTT